MTKKDEAISQIREVRHTISAEHGHDPQKLVNYYIELQKQYPQLAQFQDNRTEPVQAS
ncbi:hypothetical protein LC608_14400 [Nostoc sp. XA010]|uniref:hypothetical protein n=1 Tax=Nostoc sp. XA010 TaxID=2780407 RepID=UPI001E4AB173|nr:hypothetical protein [Nostoc sp. XA010]MCC5658160.1 hypothetical protein [Nostoc sp. XA010]